MAYERVNWLNEGEQGAKAINKTNLNIMDAGIKENDDKINEIDKKNNYSSQEQVIGIWGGKPLYRKLITGTFPTLSNSWQNIAEVGKNLKIKKISGTIDYLTLPIYINADYHINFQYASTGYIDVLGKGYDNVNFELVVEYTKTAD